MRILMIYPQYPETFWSFKYALKFIAKKATNPPLGLMTVASMLPAHWEKKLVDLNVQSLRKKDLDWADMVFLSAMTVQSKSVFQIIDKCKSHHKTVVAGGPLFTEEPDKFPEVDHLILNEAELTLPLFLKDLEHGNVKRIYRTDHFADVRTTPVPDYSLIKASKYNSMNVQYTRGCPFNCDFCDITVLFGNKVRMKSSAQMLEELEAIYNSGWRKNIFIVDDNFIGNKKILKEDFLPKLIEWMETKRHPFLFSTEASINLADDDELLRLMVQANFTTVFIGIETVDEASLAECGKLQNMKRNLVESVKKIQSFGMEVTGGFILGFDNDSISVFQRQIDFIKEAEIITAMVGLLNAPKKTRLYKRLHEEGRITGDITGDNTDCSTNLIPKMGRDQLLSGYQKVIHGIYEGRVFYHRVQEFIKWFSPACQGQRSLTVQHAIAALKSFFKLGVLDTFRKSFWQLILWTLFNRPALLRLAVTYSVYGYHFRKVFKEVL
jgi:radical SAM superfamily enzyme YgiQ (UPF0313 family)